MVYHQSFKSKKRTTLNGSKEQLFSHPISANVARLSLLWVPSTSAAAAAPSPSRRRQGGYLLLADPYPGGTACDPNIPIHGLIHLTAQARQRSQSLPIRRIFIGAGDGGGFHAQGLEIFRQGTVVPAVVGDLQKITSVRVFVGRVATAGFPALRRQTKSRSPSKAEFCL